MTRPTSLLEIGDRIAIRQLIDAYSKVAEPTFVIHGRDGLAPVFADLNQYHATTHFNGQSTVDLVGDRGTGETYCIAHHLTIKDGQRTLMVASLRYLDNFVKQDGAWLFAERKLLVDWTETRPSTA